MTKENVHNSRLALLLPIRCIAFTAIFVAGALITGKKVADISNWWSVAASAVNIFTILLVVLAAKKTGRNYAQLLNFRKGMLSAKKTVITVIVMCVIGMSGMYLSGLVCYGSVMPRVTLKIAAPIPFVLALINLIVLPATISFAEDGLYLGCGVNSFKNKYAAVIIPAFFYTLQHCFIPTIFDAKYMLYRFLMFLPLTVIFCVYYRRKKNPVPLMIAHAVLDFATGMLILITSSSAQLYEKMESML